MFVSHHSPNLFPDLPLSSSLSKPFESIHLSRQNANADLNPATVISISTVILILVIGFVWSASGFLQRYNLSSSICIRFYIDLSILCFCGEISMNPEASYSVSSERLIVGHDCCSDSKRVYIESASKLYCEVCFSLIQDCIWFASIALVCMLNLLRFYVLLCNDQRFNLYLSFFF